MMQHKEDLLGIFARHKVAPNLLMIMMIVSGVLALKLLNVQFFPTFELETVNVNTVWSGASAEDIRNGITVPLEQRLRTLENLKSFTSSSAPGLSGITLEFDDGTDLTKALEEVRKQVDDFTGLPEDAETPTVAQRARYESVARMLLTGPQSFDELRALTRQFENELLQRGIDKVDIDGLPEESIQISVPSAEMQRLGLSLSQIGSRIDASSQDLPAGLIGENDAARELRSLNQSRTVNAFAEMPLLNAQGERLALGDVAEIDKRPKSGEPYITRGDKKAVVMVLRRSESGDSLEAARILNEWYAETKPTLPHGVELVIFNERWQSIKDRIMLLVKNGGGGLILVLAILYLFLSTRVAWWVAVGIPVSFMATLAVMYLTGNTINMISLFALIMALGIIVDDAIVVGEDAQAHFDAGEPALTASEGGARRMLGPVMASSLTTVAAFLPLLLVGGRMGNIMSAIPMVIIAVIIASLIESFYILPGHLRHAFVHAERGKSGKIRQRLDNGFEFVRDRLFRPFVVLALEFRWATLALSFGSLLIAIGLLISGQVGWRFFPSPESTTVYANVRFVAGMPEQKVSGFLDHVEKALDQTLASYDEPVAEMAYVLHSKASGSSSIKGERVGSVYVELLGSDYRSVDNRQFMKDWRSRIKVPAGIENFSIDTRRIGHGSRDLEIRLKSDNATTLKQAALELAEALKDIPGVSDLDDDLPYGREQLVYSLTPAGEALGLSVLELGRQLRASYDGIRLQSFQDGADEVDVRIQLPDDERRYLNSLEQLPIRLDDGRFVPLSSVAQWDSRQGFEVLRHANGQLAVEVKANVNPAQNNVQEIIDTLQESTMPLLVREFGVDYSFEGRSADQKETLGDLKTGIYVAFLLIYLVLAWVFASYGWPLLVMLTIPLGLTGAVLGHWIMGMSLTLLSLFGFFALAGIVINDSIILVVFYKHIRAKGLAIKEALVEASCQRLRAVLLTSLTTIAGLTPLLFETSRQAQFLIPMAVSIAFGLGFATMLILLVVPSMLSIYEDVREKLSGSKDEAVTHSPEPV